jgi:Nuclease-related domain
MIAPAPTATNRLLPLGEPEDNELAAMAALDQALDPSWLIFHSLKRLKDRPDIDVLILTPKCIVVAELKHYRGAIEVRSGKEWQRVQADGLREAIPNFLQGQALRQAQKLKAELKDKAGLHHVWVEHVVIFTHTESTLQFADTGGQAFQAQVFHLKDAKARLEALLGQERLARRFISVPERNEIARLIGWPEELPAVQWLSAQKHGTEDRFAAEKRERLFRKRRRQIMAILTLTGALLVTISIYALLMTS